MSSGDKAVEAVADLIDDKLIEDAPTDTPPDAKPTETEPEPPESEETVSDDVPEEERQGEDTGSEEDKAKLAEPAEKETQTEETDEIDPESIEDPALKAYVLNLREKSEKAERSYEELQKLQGQQARELGMAREVATQNRDNFNNEIATINRDALETQAALLSEAEQETDPLRKTQLQNQAAEVKANASVEINKRITTFARGQENAFLQSSLTEGMDYTEIKPQFDDFCQSLQTAPEVVKMNPAMMSRLYEIMLGYERGKKADEMVKKAYNEGKLAAARVKNASAAPAESKLKTEKKEKPKDDPSGTTQEEVNAMLGPSKGMSFRE
jgi:hypothetical protein